MCKPNARIVSVMHKFDGSKGSLFDGEMMWEKDERGFVTQTNVKTGESYHHPDNGMWFKPECTWVGRTMPTVTTLGDISPYNAGDQDSLTWTRNIIGDFTHVVTIVSCSLSMAWFDSYTPYVQNIGEVARIKAAGGVPFYSDFVPIKAEHAEVFDEVRTSMINQPRSEAKHKAHTATVRAKVQARVKEQGLSFDAIDVSNLIEASFWIDFKRDSGHSMEVSNSGLWLLLLHDVNAAGKAVGYTRKAMDLALDIMAIGFSCKGGTKETARAVIQSLQAAMRSVK